MSWEVDPEPLDPEARAALVDAADRALAPEEDSTWWRSGLEDQSAGPPPEQAWHDARPVEP